MLVKIATSQSGSRLARSPGERWVEIWDIETRDFVAGLDTTLDAGGKRLAISNDGTLLVVGAYRRAGVAVYRLPDGAEMWRRRDVSRVQYVMFAEHLSAVCVAREGAPALALDLTTGATLARWPGVRGIFVGPDPDSILFNTRRGYRWSAAGPLRLSHSQDQAVALAAAFAATRVYVSEVGGPLRAIEIASSREVETWLPDAGTHWLTLACTDGDSLALVRFDYERGPVFLERLDGSSDRVETIVELSSFGHVFASGGSLVIAADGECRRTDTGALVDRFAWRF